MLSYLVRKEVRKVTHLLGLHSNIGKTLDVIFLRSMLYNISKIATPATI